MKTWTKEEIERLAPDFTGIREPLGTDFKGTIIQALLSTRLDLETARTQHDLDVKAMEIQGQLLAAKDREIEGFKDLLGRLKGVVVDTILPNAKNVSLDIVEEMAWNSVCKETDEVIAGGKS